MDLAQRLLDAHTRFQVEQLRGGSFAALVETEVDHLLEAASRLTLDDVVDREQVTGVAVKYIGAFRLPGAIPEIAGDIALRVRSHAANQATVEDVLPTRHVAAALGKIVEMQSVRERLGDRLAQSPAVHLWLSDFLHSLTIGAVASNRRFAERIPGVSSALSVGDRLVGGAVREADKLGRAAAERAAHGILNRSRESLAESAGDDFVDTLLDVWAETSNRSMADVLDAIDDDDLVDVVAVAYDFYLDFRENPYLHSMVATGVDYFFDTYGDFTLDTLLTEFGLGRADLVEEAMRFAPRAIAALDEAGELEALVRRRLGAFYDSPEAQALLAQPSD